MPRGDGGGGELPDEEEGCGRNKAKWCDESENRDAVVAYLRIIITIRLSSLAIRDLVN